MASRQERRKHARPEEIVGYVSRYAQQRVDKRVMEIMKRRDAAEGRDQALPAPRAWRRPVGSRG